MILLVCTRNKLLTQLLYIINETACNGNQHKKTELEQKIM